MRQDYYVPPDNVQTCFNHRYRLFVRCSYFLWADCSADCECMSRWLQKNFWSQKCMT